MTNTFDYLYIQISLFNCRPILRQIFNIERQDHLIREFNNNIYIKLLASTEKQRSFADFSFDFLGLTGLIATICMRCVSARSLVDEDTLSL